jgi:hypothetical protein
MISPARPTRSDTSAGNENTGRALDSVAARSRLSEGQDGIAGEISIRAGAARATGQSSMSDKRIMLRHFLAALAYRTQKALRGAPPSFAGFSAGQQVRTPADLVRHMTSVLGYARSFFVGGRYWPEPLPDLAAEVTRFHAMLEDLAPAPRGGNGVERHHGRTSLAGPICRCDDPCRTVGYAAQACRVAGAAGELHRSCGGCGEPWSEPGGTGQPGRGVA